MPRTSAPDGAALATENMPTSMQNMADSMNFIIEVEVGWLSVY